MHQPHMNAPLYPILVLPSAFRESVIDRAHRECGHLGHWKTLRRITEAYVWRHMRKDVRLQLLNCPVCLTHNRHPQRYAMGEHVIASYPMEMISADLIGPLVESPNGSKYILTIIDFCTGWAEAFPLRSKTNECVWSAFSGGFIARHGVPQVLLTDNGKEFTAFVFERYLQQIGIEHRTTTPMHPQCNGKIERFNRTIKEMITKAVQNQPSRWESVLNDALLSYRASVSTTTGYTPHFLMTCRMLRMPLQKALRVSNDEAFGNRLDALASALKIARMMTVDSRKHNRDRLAKKATTQSYSPGDAVVIKAEARVPLTSRWENMCTVTRVRGPVLFLHHQQTGTTKVLNREKCRLVNSAQNWDTCNPRPRRKQTTSTQMRKLYHRSNETAPNQEDVENESVCGDMRERRNPSVERTRRNMTENKREVMLKRPANRRKRRKCQSLSED